MGRNQNVGSVLLKVLLNFENLSSHFVRKQHFIIEPFELFILPNFEHKSFSQIILTPFERYFHSIEWREFIVPTI